MEKIKSSLFDIINLGDIMDRVYACIDLKSFYASCECKELGLDPITTNLVVADISRTSKTICLAVSPSLKKYGLSGRARLFEVVSKVNEENLKRKRKNHYKEFTGKTSNDNKLKINPNLAIDYIIAKPRMSLYMKYSSEIYNVYLKFLSKEDIFVYSIDEVFCDLTNYLKYNNIEAHELVSKMIMEVYNKTGITATGGIGTNMYLAKVAMDIMAKHTKPNKDGVRIAELNEIAYREKLWDHTPLTDFWRIGKGISEKLMANKMYTMGDICKESISNEAKLFKLFGINAELIIDHAWGIEPCTIKDVKNYKPENNSISTNQVLHEPYSKLKAKIIVCEMVDDLVINLVSKNLVTNMVVLNINYDTDNLKNNYNGKIKKDYYGRSVPDDAHGTIKLDHLTSSFDLIKDKLIELYEKIVDSNLTIRRIGIAFLNVVSKDNSKAMQIDLFNPVDLKKEDDENKVTNAVINIKKKYGKNAILRGIDLVDGATARERNNQIGGHRA